MHEKPGRVLNSTSTSKVFVNFVDHGGVGIIGFPTGVMHATELMAALKTMHSKKMYKELVFYLETCESGSMFTKLGTDLNIYATTAANAKESSWGTYCSPDDKVDGKSLNTCLGDLFSVKWMENSDATASETLQQQFERVKKEVNKSHVLQFGTKAIASESINDFQGNASSATTTIPMTDVEHASSRDSRSIALTLALDRFLEMEDDASAAALQTLIQRRLAVAKRFTLITTAVAGASDLAARPTPDDFDLDCHYAAHKAYLASCGQWTPEALKHSATLAKLCKHTGGDAGPIRRAVQAACA